MWAEGKGRGTEIRRLVGEGPLAGLRGLGKGAQLLGHSLWTRADSPTPKARPGAAAHWQWALIAAALLEQCGGQEGDSGPPLLQQCYYWSWESRKPTLSPVPSRGARQATGHLRHLAAHLY